jgi:SAM-dependent methyltransferase
MRCHAETFGPERDTLLQRVDNRVLDVGCGGGAYLRHCTKATTIVALEPVVEMHATIRRVAEEAGISDEKLEILPLTIQEYVEYNMRSETGDAATPPPQFDWILVGNVLCEVPHPISTALQSIKLLTKPGGGHVYFSEHVGARPGTWARLFQDTINPVWTKVSGGCNCNRDTLNVIHSCLEEKDWEFGVWEYPNVQVAMGPSFLGLARKK